MSKAIIVFESRWGNTRLVAEKIAEGMKQVPGTEVAIEDVKDLDNARLSNYGIILIGSPNHIGGATRNIGSLVNKLGELHLDGKSAATFDTCWSADHGKTSGKLERMISQKAPGIKIISPGLSVVISGMKGPVPDNEQVKCVEFGKKIAAQAA